MPVYKSRSKSQNHLSQNSLLFPVVVGWVFFFGGGGVRLFVLGGCWGWVFCFVCSFVCFCFVLFVVVVAFCCCFLFLPALVYEDASYILKYRLTNLCIAYKKKTLIEHSIDLTKLKHITA